MRAAIHIALLVMGTAACARDGFGELAVLTGDPDGLVGDPGAPGDPGDPGAADTDPPPADPGPSFTPTTLSASQALVPGGLAQTGDGQIVAVGHFNNVYNGTDYDGTFTVNDLTFAQRHGSSEIFEIGVGTSPWQQLYGQAGALAELDGGAANTSAVFGCGDLVGSLQMQGQNISAPSRQQPLITRHDSAGNFTGSLLIPATTANAQCSVIAANDSVVAVAGLFGGTVNPGGGSATAQADPNSFVAVYDATSFAFKWQATHVSTAHIFPRGVAIAGDGGVYFGAQFSAATDFGTGTMTPTGANDSVVLRYDAAGTIQWGVQIRGGSDDLLYGLAPRTDGGVFACVTTSSSSVTFDGVGGSLSGGTAGGSDIAIAAYDAAGALQWAHVIGGAGTDACYQAVADAQGNLYLTGVFQDSVEFAPGIPTARTGSGGFVAAYDPSGTLLWVHVYDVGSTVMRASVGPSGVWAFGTFVGTVTLSGTIYTERSPYSAFVEKITP